MSGFGWEEVGLVDVSGCGLGMTIYFVFTFVFFFFLKIKRRRYNFIELKDHMSKKEDNKSQQNCPSLGHIMKR